jgi:hypothetical protein
VALYHEAHRPRIYILREGGAAAFQHRHGEEEGKGDAEERQWQTSYEAKEVGILFYVSIDCVWLGNTDDVLFFYCSQLFVSRCGLCVLVSDVLCTKLAVTHTIDQHVYEILERKCFYVELILDTALLRTVVCKQHFVRASELLVMYVSLAVQMCPFQLR